MSLDQAHTHSECDCMSAVVHVEAGEKVPGESFHDVFGE
jgi:hypothetical protein